MMKLKLLLRLETLLLIAVGALVIPTAAHAYLENTGRTAVTPARAADPDLTGIDALVGKAEEQGGIRIIVELAVPFDPEGYLEQETAAQGLDRIRQAQQSVLAGLNDYRAVATAEFRYIPFIGLELDAPALLRLAALPDVKSIHEEMPARPALESTLPIIGANWTRDSGFAGAGQTIAILDSGIDPTHPFVNSGGDRIVSEACYSTTSSLLGSSSLCPGGAGIAVGPGTGSDCVAVMGPARPNSLRECEHGTHVAGIAAGNDGQQFGVAPEADLISIQVFSALVNPDLCGNNVECLITLPTDYLLGLERIYELSFSFDIASVNMSLGGLNLPIACDDPATASAVDLLALVGVRVVASSGNDSMRNSMGSPACVSGVVSVGNSTDDDQVASTSNIAWFIDLLAPGTVVTSSIPISRANDPTYAFLAKSGTSMSAPHVTGAWALLREAYPNETLGDTLARLKLTGTLIDDQRSNGVITDIPRINVDLALATYVDLAAGWPTETGHPAWPFDSVQEAVNAAPSAAMVRIAPGIYDETVIIDRPMELRTTGGLVTIGTP